MRAPDAEAGRRGTPPGRPGGRPAGSGRGRPGTPQPGGCSPGSSRWCCPSGSRRAGDARRSGAGWGVVRGHGRTVAQAREGQGMGPVSVMRPVETARETELTSVSAGQPGCGAPRRNRTGDPILTMEPPGTAVRTAASPGHAGPSGPKLSVLLPRSYASSSHNARSSLEQTSIRVTDREFNRSPAADQIPLAREDAARFA